MTAEMEGVIFVYSIIYSGYYIALLVLLASREHKLALAGVVCDHF